MRNLILRRRCVEGRPKMTMFYGSLVEIMRRIKNVNMSYSILHMANVNYLHQFHKPGAALKMRHRRKYVLLTFKIPQIQWLIGFVICATTGN